MIFAPAARADLNEQPIVRVLFAIPIDRRRGFQRSRVAVEHGQPRFLQVHLNFGLQNIEVRFHARCRSAAFKLLNSRYHMAACHGIAAMLLFPVGKRIDASAPGIANQVGDALAPAT